MWVNNPKEDKVLRKKTIPWSSSGSLVVRGKCIPEEMLHPCFVSIMDKICVLFSNTVELAFFLSLSQWTWIKRDFRRTWALFSGLNPNSLIFSGRKLQKRKSLCFVSVYSWIFLNIYLEPGLLDLQLEFCMPKISTFTFQLEVLGVFHYVM